MAAVLQVNLKMSNTTDFFFRIFWKIQNFMKFIIYQKII